MSPNSEPNDNVQTQSAPMTMRLDRYAMGDYTCGAPIWKQLLWYFIGGPLVQSYWLPFSGMKATMLRLFGAQVGPGVRIKPGVRVKFPWRLSIGAHSWIGEDCWLDSNAQITIGDQVCLSQGVYLCTGNHDWGAENFALRCQPIEVKRGSWICAQAKISPGVTVGEGAVLTLGSVASQSLESQMIYAGNPAQVIKKRTLRSC